MGCFLLELAILSAISVSWCSGHGRLISPPSRASAWRFGFNTPINYNDNEGNCGGFYRQWQRNKGKCGVCGDPWEANPRPHEKGGLYATETIVANYTQGDTIPVVVDVTANHRGKMQFRICPILRNKRASQKCLNRHPLFMADGGGFSYEVGSRSGKHKILVKLPKDLRCRRCVMQWRYVAGNNWGHCADGSSGLGCGPQEEFRACADVTIRPSQFKVDGTLPPTPHGSHDVRTTLDPLPTKQETTIPPKREMTTHSPPYSATPSVAPKPTGKKVCSATPSWEAVPGMNGWCQSNCNHIPPFCPSSHCICL